jgi:heterotetrameric sarcosine oxidase gamma subunit
MNKSAAFSPLQQAGITGTEFRSANLLLRELPDTRLLRLRSLQPELTTAALRDLGLDLPSSTGGSAGIDPAILCLRPNEWLVYSSSGTPGGLLDRVQARLNGAQPEGGVSGHTAALDMSDGLAVLQLGGAAAPWLLAKLSSLDFLGARETGQHCARTRMGQVAVVVNYHPLAASSTEFVYDLILDRSIARYLWELLLHAASHAEEMYTRS